MYFFFTFIIALGFLSIEELKVEETVNSPRQGLMTSRILLLDKLEIFYKLFNNVDTDGCAEVKRKT